MAFHEYLAINVNMLQMTIQSNIAGNVCCFKVSFIVNNLQAGSIYS